MAHASASPPTGTLSYRPRNPQITRAHSFGGWLEPRTLDQ